MDSGDGSCLPIGWRARSNKDYVEAVMPAQTGDFREYTIREKYERMTTDEQESMLSEGDNREKAAVQSLPVGWSKRHNRMNIEEMLTSKSASVIAVAEVNMKQSSAVQSSTNILDSSGDRDLFLTGSSKISSISSSGNESNSASNSSSSSSSNNNSNNINSKLLEAILESMNGLNTKVDNIEAKFQSMELKLEEIYCKQDILLRLYAKGMTSS